MSRHARSGPAGLGLRVFLLGMAAALAAGARIGAVEQAPIQFVFTSDVHYGITRATFRGGRDVAAHDVDAAMVVQINALPDATFPKDGGLRGGDRRRRDARPRV